MVSGLLAGCWDGWLAYGMAEGGGSKNGEGAGGSHFISARVHHNSSTDLYD